MPKDKRLLDASRLGPAAQSFRDMLRLRVIGQDEAVDEIANHYQRHLVGLLPPGRPVGNFLFFGPTGSGKTKIVEAAAELLTRSPKSVVRIDCAEFRHSHEIAKLIGSPPGYLAHRNTHPILSQEALSQHHTEHCKLCFVLFDEIEKASDALWNLLLGILDKATLTLGDNRRVDFSHALIFMTSNLGAPEMGPLMELGLGFNPGFSQSSLADRQSPQKLGRIGLAALRSKFSPEFVNRLDRILAFKRLGVQELRLILEIELNAFQQRIFDISPDSVFVFELTEAAKEFVLSQGTDLRYGARHLKRTIERLVSQPLGNLMATKQAHRGDVIRVDFASGETGLDFTRVEQGLRSCDMADKVHPSVRLREYMVAAHPW